MNGTRGNVGVGGNDPTRASQIQQTSNMVNPPAPPGGPMAPPQAGMAQPAPVQNEVAQYLAMAFEALTRTGPTPENLAAVQGFLSSIQQLSSGGGQAAPAPAAPAPMGGQAPLPPQPAANAPLPPMR